MAPRKPDKDNKKNIPISFHRSVGLLLTVMFNYLTSLASKGSSTEITYSEFVSMVKNGEVASVAINESEGKLRHPTVTAANAPEGTEAAKEELYTGILDDAQLLRCWRRTAWNSARDPNGREPRHDVPAILGDPARRRCISC
jgi:ATP-dependent Zn protease